MRWTLVLGSLKLSSPLRTRPKTSLFDRPARLMGLLAVLFTLSSFDLGFTQAQMIRGNFRELNTVAAGFVAAGPMHAAAYKMVLLGIGVVVLYRLRRHWLAEAAAWGLVGAHVGLMAWWLVYLHYAEQCWPDPFTDSLPLIY